MEPITREEMFMAAAAQGLTELEPITRREYFLNKIAEAVKNGGGGSTAQSDWNALEGESGYILNRPFGLAHSMLYNVENESFSDLTGYGIIMNEMSVSLGLINGETYTVTWDGVAYECVATVADGQEMLGNMLLMGGSDTGEPFTYMSADGITAFADVTATGASQHNISVEGLGMQKISADLLQDNGQSDWLQEDTTRTSYIVNKPFGITKLATYSFDGVLTDKVMVKYGEADSEGDEAYFVKVADDLVRTYDLCFEDPNDPGVFCPMKHDWNNYSYSSAHGLYFAASERQPNTVFVYWVGDTANKTSELLGLTFPETGVYLRVIVNNGEVVYAPTIPVYGYTKMNRLHLPTDPVDYITLRSSTPGSTKTFRLYVTEDGEVKVL